MVAVDCGNEVLELGLEAIFASQVASSEWVVVEHARNQPPVVSEDRHVPPKERNLAIIEYLKLLLSPIFLVDLLDPPSEVFHCLL